MAKQIVKARLKTMIERMMKNFMTSGRDLGVIIKLFQVCGLIDAVLIEHGELKPISVLSMI